MENILVTLEGFRHVDAYRCIIEYAGIRVRVFKKGQKAALLAAHAEWLNKYTQKISKL